MKRHPAFDLERAHVDKTTAYISGELIRVGELEEKQREEVNRLFIQSGGRYTNDLFIATELHSMTARTLNGLQHAVHTPYFTRVDFIPKNKKQKELYIGKWGVLDPITRKPVVVDWRSGAANLYYTHQVGPASYPTPLGDVEGEITLKRLFSIEDGELKSIVEADIISEGEYLNDVLSGHADARLKDIVTTIQAEQNAVIRSSPRKPMVVQGVAGAGKTTIALHRITWLLYTFKKTMSPRNLMIIAPSPLFLDYISAVLPDLGVDDVIQETFLGLATRLCGRKLYRLDDAHALISLIDAEVDEDTKRQVEATAQFKGSLDFKACVEAYIKQLPEKLLPPEDFRLGPINILERDQILAIYTKELSPFPYKQRPAELKKRLKQVLNESTEHLKMNLERETEKRANLLRIAVAKNTELRRQKMQGLYAARDKRLEEIDTLKKGLVDTYIKSFPKIKLLDHYRAFLSEEPAFELPEGVTPKLWQDTCRMTHALLDKRRMESADLPPLILLQKALLGHAERLDIHHTVLDEAQDFSPFMFDILKGLTHNDAFTIVGDLAQGIYSFRGVCDWQKMMHDVFENQSIYHELVTSYRNTIEIMELAEHCAMKHAHPGRLSAKPVLRHGEEPEIRQVESGYQHIADEVGKLREKGSKTVAIIEKLPRDCKKTYNALKKLIPDVQLLTDDDFKYQGGIMVLPAHLVKGLEFDAVIICDASEETFPDDALHARLLYVCLTRPLHYLKIFYKGQLSPLLT